jgi:(p)ppGpp synthase/HD superfamily hydrolase
MFGSEISRKATKRRMVSWHRGQKRRLTGLAYSSHPPEVATLAEALGLRHFTQRKLLMPADKAIVDNMWHAAMFHGVITIGRNTWDEVLDATNLEVANIVADVSPDNRLSRPRRVKKHANRLFHADLPARIVKLADLCCTLRDVLNMLGAVDCNAGWPDEISDYVNALEKLATHGRFKDEWTWCHETTLSLKAVDGQWERIDIARAIDACPEIISAAG